MSEQMSKFVQAGRVYIHSECDTETCVTEEHFVGICNPFCLGTNTYCVGCEDFFPLDDVFWADTDESIADYRRRLLSKTPVFWQLWARELNLITGAVVGGFVGAVLARNGNPLVGILVGAVFGAGGLRATINGGMIARLIGVEFHRTR